MAADVALVFVFLFFKAVVAHVAVQAIKVYDVTCVLLTAYTLVAVDVYLREVIGCHSNKRRAVW